MRDKNGLERAVFITRRHEGHEEENGMPLFSPLRAFAPSCLRVRFSAIAFSARNYRLTFLESKVADAARLRAVLDRHGLTAAWQRFEQRYLSNP